MTTVLPLQCFACARLDRSEGDIGTSGLPDVVKCSAFPDGIPDVMFDGGDHREPLGGEVDGRLFQLSKKPAEAENFEFWEKVFGPQSGG